MRRSAAVAGSVVFFVAAPGVVAGLVPWLLTGWRVRAPLPYWAPVRVLGAVLAAAGLAALVHAFAEFVNRGRGTPAPVAAPDRLVVTGTYRYVRNPMYVAVVAIIVGQALLLGQPVLLLYALAGWAVPAAFVRWYEEPALARRFGAAYQEYRDAVPAWWPRPRPWTPGDGEPGGNTGASGGDRDAGRPSAP